MKARKVLFVSSLLVGTLLLAACGSPQETEGAIETFIYQTQQISELQTAAAGGDEGEDGEEADEEEASEPTDTPTPENSPTPSTPLVSVSVDTNCRSGPALSFAHLTTILAGEEVEVLFTSPDPNYVIVQRPGGSGSCWLWLRYADRTDFSGYNLPVATLPPTPTFTNTPIPYEWEATWTIWAPTGGYSMPVTVSGSSFSSSWSDGAGNIVMTGTISANGQTVSGSYTYSAGADGTFQFQIKSGNLNQFVGSGDNGAVFAWCGAKSGASMPSPCQWP